MSVWFILKKKSWWLLCTLFLRCRHLETLLFPGKRNDTETSVESFVQEDGDGK